MFTNKPQIFSLTVFLSLLAYSAAVLLTDATFAVCGAPGSC